MKRTLTRIALGLVMLTGLFTPTTSHHAFATESVGGDDKDWGPSQVSFGSILPVVAEFGRVSLSVDGLGTLNTDGPIGVNKPSGATVRKAYMAAATTGFSGYTLPPGVVSINGASVIWGISTQSSIASWNYWADVTALIKPVIDVAPPGRTSLNVMESDPSAIDGEILAVVFDDPNQTTDNTVVLLFGAQAVNGDTFAVRFANPVDKSDPNLLLDMSLGISYGYQAVGYGTQTSTVDVNGQRLTSSAGGQDDAMKNGFPASNGTLLTVGGLDDTDDNPPPFASAATNGARTDDELYDLEPFVNTGDTLVNVFTQNPSRDDNIFFAAFNLRSTSAIVGEGIVLGPSFASNPVGSPHTVIATVQDEVGNPVAGRDVTFNVLSGPDAGATFVAPTDAGGQSSFTFTGLSAGNDVIEASFVNSQQVTVSSNTVIAKWLPPSNQPPTALPGGPYNVNEGGTVTLNGSGTDPDGDPLVYAWDLDNNGSFETGGQDAVFSAAGRDGPDSQTVGLQVCDIKVACTTAQTTVNILNVAPGVSEPTVAPGASDEGSAVTASAQFTDPAGASDAPFNCTVDYGDGTGSQAGSISGFTCTGAAHTYADNGSYTVSVSVTDKDGGTGSNTTNQVVNNIAPTILTVTAPPDPTLYNTAINTGVSFSDPGIFDTHTVVWGWGDGTTSSGAVTESNGAGSATGTHVYASAGIYTVGVTVTDKDGGYATSTYQYVVVYNPNGGFVTGGGWINSPAGAYLPNPTLTGRANFGLISRYLPGHQEPDGNTEFNLQAGNMRFHSTSYDGLVISGAKAQYTGSGTINGQAGYSFILTAWDGQVSGGGAVDKFRIRILNGNALVYDNQPGAPDNADPTTALGGGSIQIHNNH